MIVVFVYEARYLRVVVKHKDSLFVFCQLRLQLSFCLTIVHKLAICAADFVDYARFGLVCIILRFRTWKEALDGDLWFEGDFDTLLFWEGQFVLKLFARTGVLQSHKK